MNKKFVLLIFSITGEIFLLNQLIFHFDTERLKAFLISLSLALIAGLGVHFYKKKQQSTTSKK